MDPTALARAFRQWLEDPDVALEETVRAIADVDEPVWRQLARDESLITLDVTHKLISLAHYDLGRDPRRSVWLSRLAIRVATDLWLPETKLDSVIAAEGDAWREHAAALLEVGEFADARLAAERARLVYDLSSVTGHNRAVLGVIEGRVLHELGDSDAGILLIEQNANLLLSLFKDRKAYVRAQTVHAAILFSRGEYGRAAEMLSRVTTMAEAQHDTETLAYTVNMVGRCSVKLGDYARAEQCFQTALTMFEELGLHAEMPRVRKGIVEILITKGRYNEAISELYMARSEFLVMEMPVMAALVSLDVVDLLLVTRRASEMVLLCREMIAVFTNAGLPENALAALIHVRMLADRGALAENDVREVRDYLELLPSAPGRRFRDR